MGLTRSDKSRSRDLMNFQNVTSVKRSGIQNSPTMPRLYTLFASLVLIVYIPYLTLAHTIQVAAGKKECFFEDLHINDQVRVPKFF